MFKAKRVVKTIQRHRVGDLAHENIAVNSLLGPANAAKHIVFIGIRGPMVLAHIGIVEAKKWGCLNRIHGGCCIINIIGDPFLVPAEGLQYIIFIGIGRIMMLEIERIIQTVILICL